MAVTRKATHRGSWYTASRDQLDKQMENWLESTMLSHGPARAIIAPHAGYSYCGECASWAYRQISPAVVRRIFILGPSHNVRLPGCAISWASTYQTPFYDLTVDSQVYQELRETGQFEFMSIKTDENEHSIEMQLPFIAKIMENFRFSFTIVPILVGSLSPEKEVAYGRIFAPYLEDPQNLFVISSDFCHWGRRFGYTYYDDSGDPIHRCIENLDKRGMDIIETLNHQSFTDYLGTYGNTICGRHPIGVLLQALESLQGRGRQMALKFLDYRQSSQCEYMHESSVSYASASLVVE